MKITRKRGYNNFGMLPLNEYTTSYTETNTDSDVVLAQDQDQYPPASDAEREQRALSRLSRRLHYQSGSAWNTGWQRSRSTSGWRAEAAAQQHEDKHTGAI